MASKGAPKAAAGIAAAGGAIVAGKLVRDRLSAGRPSRGYRFEPGEPLPEAIARVADGRLGHAIDELRGKTDSTPGEAVHKARKDMKKLRSLLRLARKELGEEAYRRENEGFRDVGRSLSGARDADVMVKTLDALAERYPAELPAATHSGLRNAVTQLDGSDAQAATLEEAAGTLEAARDRVRDWPLDKAKPASLEKGLRRAYRRGRRARRASLADPSTEHLHDWRKRVKDLWYHATLLEPIAPERLGPLAERAHALSDRLGDDHDLAVLGDWAALHPAAAGGSARLEAVQHAIGRRRGELQAEAFELADIYDDKPKKFVRRLGLARAWPA